MNTNREQMNVVIVGHVDHGKSTVVGRLMADTGALPEGRLEQVRRHCELNSRPFEYAFLLDALKDEQAQGITIDAARCFFKTALRDYIIIDAPGHVEFLKNMVTGAARAEAALLVIDAWVCGLRREQSVTRTALNAVEYDEANNLVKINPLASWSEEDVNIYIANNNVPTCSLYGKGFRSIGCAPCTRAVLAGEDARAGRWWWENPEQKECGLHKRPTSY